MKKLTGLITALFIGLASLNAMSYEEARDRARYLTDKMAYELNLNDQQYNDAYEINLDYLMNIRTESDAAGVYLEYRNTDLRFILCDWQYALFRAAEYFFQPVVWKAGAWFFPVCSIYKVDYYFYSPPWVYHVYRGGHWAYRHERQMSFYAKRRPAWNGGMRGESKESVHQPEQARVPGWGYGTGFHFEPVAQFGNRQNAQSSTKPKEPQRASSTATKRQQSSSSRTPTYVRNQQSNYTHRSSTRTTVNRTSTRQPETRKSTQATPARSGNAQAQKKSTAQRATRSSAKNKAASQRDRNK